MLKMAYVLAVDVGSTHLRCFAVNKENGCIHEDRIFFEPINVEYSEGRAEIDPEAIWMSCRNVIQQAVALVGAENVACMGLTTQRSCVVLWERETGKPFNGCKVMTWQDRRGLTIAETWRERLSVKLLHAGAAVMHLFTRMGRFKAGKSMDLKYQTAATKLVWCLENMPNLRERANRGEICYGGLDSWLLYKLTNDKEHKMDYSQVSATNLFDPFIMGWSSFVLHLLNIPVTLLPKLCDTAGDFGSTVSDLFGRAIPIRSSVADQQSSLFAQGCWDAGSTKVTMGTGTFINVNCGSTPQALEDGIYPMVGWKIGKEIVHIAEGNAASTGSAIDWACKSFSLFESPEDSEVLARQCDSSDGVYFVPAFDGLQAPHWDPCATVCIIGISHRTSKSHLTRALLESFVFHLNQLKVIFTRNLPYDMDVVHIDGGVSRNGLILEMISNLLQVKLKVPAQVEMTGLGAAYLAGLSHGVWTREEIKRFICHKKEVNPIEMFDTKCIELQSTYRVWQRAVERSMQWNTH